LQALQLLCHLMCPGHAADFLMATFAQDLSWHIYLKKKKECNILKYDAHTTASAEKLTYLKNVPEILNLLFFKLNAYEIYNVVRK